MITPRLSACFTGLALLLGGCAATTTPETDAHFGMAVTTARAQQTLRPEASRNQQVVTGLEGTAARGAMDKYRSSYATEAAEAKSPSTVINAGGQ